MSNYTEHYHPNSQVSVEEMDNLYTVLDDEQAAIIAHAKMVGKNRTYRMPVGQHPAEIAAALNEAKAEMVESRMERFMNVFQILDKFNFDADSNFDERIDAALLSRQIVAGQIVNHL